MIYLDNAATTLHKPPEVVRAVSCAMQRAATPGRGGHRAARHAAEIAFRCREEAAALFRVPSPEQVVFTFNATHALNMAIHTLVRPGSRVLISGYEHNAVTRPLHAVPNVEILTAKGELFQPEQMLEDMRKKMTQRIDAVICTHVSNVFGYILPVREIARLCREKDIPLIIDASQSAGILPFDFSELSPAFAAMPGHKGLYGPQGTGLLLCGQSPEPVLQGGTGSESVRQYMPEFLPDRGEAGTHNIAGIAGLLEGIRYVRRSGSQIADHEQHLLHQLAQGLRELVRVQVFAVENTGEQSGVLSFRVPEMDCETLGERLGDAGVAVRAGLHCAPLAHQTAGTLESGTVRVSFSAFNTRREVQQFLQILHRILE